MVAEPLNLLGWPGVAGCSIEKPFLDRIEHLPKFTVGVCEIWRFGCFCLKTGVQSFVNLREKLRSENDYFYNNDHCFRCSFRYIGHSINILFLVCLLAMLI